jgi:carboxyl-terminal processing protease
MKSSCTVKIKYSCSHQFAQGVSLAVAALFVACGGDDNSSTQPAPSLTCDVPAQNVWLRDYLQSFYYWTGKSPNPEPTSYDTVQSYFDAQRYAGDAVVPKDRWSYLQDAKSYNQFFAEGKALGYGFSVNGLEKQATLKVRYVEARSPAATQLQRGDTVLSLNGRGAADLISAQDFSALNVVREGEVLTVVVDSPMGPKTVMLNSANYNLTPVPAVKHVLTLPNGSRVGYLVLKDFIPQAEAPMAAALAEIHSAGAAELILDLRYNGGGRISTANMLASLIAGVTHNGQVFARLRNNANHRSLDNDFTLSGATSPGFSLVVVLTGGRTCSASELVINGLKPYTNVVTVGAASCGKPFGFRPVSNCSITYSAVNFESFNALGQGAYYNGIAPACVVTEDFNGALDSSAEKLTSAAMSYLHTGACPVVSAQELVRAAALRPTVRSPAVVEPGERQGMWTD